MTHTQDIEAPRWKAWTIVQAVQFEDEALTKRAGVNPLPALLRGRANGLLALSPIRRRTAGC